MVIQTFNAIRREFELQRSHIWSFQEEIGANWDKTASDINQLKNTELFFNPYLSLIMSEQLRAVHFFLQALAYFAEMYAFTRFETA